MTTTAARSADRHVGRVPPHSREAEESVLGAILLSADAANQVMDRLAGGDFYVPAHQAIFEAISALYNANQAIDAVTVAEELRRTGELEKVGGGAYLTHLVDVVPVVSNIDYYAGIVEEHALRRSLIRAGSAVTDFAFRTDDEVSSVLDRAEQEIFAVAERRVGEGMLSVGPMFQEAIEHIEALETGGTEITGLSTGFRDLDRKLAGLQKANFLVIAARPSMGKCLAAGTRVLDAKTASLVPIEELATNPDRLEGARVLSLDLNTGEFIEAALAGASPSGERPTWRIVTRLGRELIATSNHPLLTVEGWRRVDQLRVGDAVATPGRVGVFGVDRRLDAEAALLGYLIGDGSFRAATPSLSSASRVVVEDVSRWARELGVELVGGHGFTYRLRSQPAVSQDDIARALGVSASTVSLALGEGRVASRTRARVREAARQATYVPRRLRTNPVRRLLEECGLHGAGSHEKFVPELVFRLPEDQLALFLNRLYATDGSAWTSGDLFRIEYTSVSERLARDVQHLLLRFGVVTKLVHRRVRYGSERRSAWTVQVQDPDGVLRFARRIGIFGKEQALAAVVAVASSRTIKKSASSLLPMSVWDLVLAEKADRTWADISAATGRSRGHNWHVRTRRLSRRLLRELAEAMESPRLGRLGVEDVVWDPIVSVEPAGIRPTYDLSVPGPENFLAADIVAHNSSLTLNVATNVASGGGTVALFSLEMAKEEIVQRILCSVGRVDSMKLRTGQLNPQLWDRVVAAASRMYRAPIFIDDTSVATVTDIRAKCRRLKRAHGLELVVVDYLQLMHGISRENRQQEIAEISRGLKNLARELEVPIIGVSQLNRSVEQREDRRPRLSDLRESGSLEQDADVVMFVYRHEYYHPEDVEKKGMAEVNIAKHRTGSTGIVEMTFLAEYTRFADLGRDVT